MVDGELEEEMMIAHNRVVNYSSWYQSKSIKESLKESELNYPETLLNSWLVSEDKKSTALAAIEASKEKIQKYGAQKPKY